MGKDQTLSGDKDRKFTVQVTSPSQCARVLSIEIPSDEVSREEERLLKKLRSELKIPGFRKGKVPLGYIHKNYGDMMHSDAVRNLLPVVYEQALEREGIDPVSSPTFENMTAKKGESITVDIHIEVRPEVKIDGYAGLKIEAKKHEIGEEDVNRALDQLRERMATFKVVEREARDGDYLIIDYGPLKDDGSVDDKDMMHNHPIDLSAPMLMKEFKEGLTGMRAGEDTRLTVHYPDDYPEKDLAGTQKNFYAKVSEVKEKVIPEVNDEFVKQLGAGMNSAEELEAEINSNLLQDEDKRYQREVEDKIIASLIAKNPFEVPDAMVDNYLTSVLEEDRRRRPQVPDEEAREKEVRETFREGAVQTVKRYFVMEAIKSQENITVTDEDLMARIEEIAGSSEDKDKVRDFFRVPQNRSRLENELLDEKVLSFLRDKADIKSVE